MARALIVGAGAIGRGFLPWVLEEFDIDFYDASPSLTVRMANSGSYRTFMSIGGVLTERNIRPRAVTSDLSKLDLAAYDVAFVAVGPRNTRLLPDSLSQLTCPVFSLENDPATVMTLTAQYGLKRAFFGVPDVIASSSASPDHLAADSLALHTEAGVLYLEDSPEIPEEVKSALRTVEWTDVNQLRREWDAKLYLHNTPHCVAAYLGYLAGFEYLHEGFTTPFIQRTVEGVVEEMLLALKMTTTHDHRFMESYAIKEMLRFSNAQLYDPISRVAREPLRKLAPSGRLTGALRMALVSGVAPVNLMTGIAAALSFLDPSDDDSQYLRLLDAFGVQAFLQFHLSISVDSLESQYIDTNLQPARQLLARNISWTS